MQASVIRQTRDASSRRGRCAASVVRAVALALGLSLPTPDPSSAQDLPNPPSNLEEIPAGSLVIPMDLAHQSLVAPFNMKAYGLVNDLLQNDIPVKWAIRAGKPKDGIDFSATVQRIAPTALGPSSEDFRSGPFIVHVDYRDLALARVTAFGNSVAVYELTQSATVDIRHTLVFKPKVLVNVTNAGIHTQIFDQAGIPDYVVDNDFNILDRSCFTMVTEPHSTDTEGIAPVKTFVESGGNFFAQCASLDTYENDPAGGFQTTGGTTTDNISNGLSYPNPDLPVAQFEGALAAAPGGSHQDWYLNAGSNFTNNGHVLANNVGASPAEYAATGAKLYAGGPGGMVFYLGGHNYDDSPLEELNGRRILMNAVLTPASRPSECGFDIPTADLTIAKSHTGDFSVGTSDTYTITVTNVGDGSTVADVTVTDSLPSGLTYVSATGAGWSFQVNGQVVTATYSTTIGSGGAASFQLTVAIDQAAVPGVTNRVHVAGGGDVNTGNNSASDATTIVHEADVVVVKTGPAGALENDTIAYVVTTSNDGPSPAAQVVVSDTLPAGLGFVSATRGATAAAGVVTWPAIDTLASASSVADTVWASVDAAPDTVVNVAAAVSTTPDPDSTNNDGSAPASRVTTELSAGALADLQVLKSGPATVVEGDTVTYVITTSNDGPSAAAEVAVTDTLPPGVTFVSASRGAVYDGGTGAVTWPAVATLAAGASLSDTVVVVAPVPDTLLNLAAATNATPDPDPTNNDGSDSASRVSTAVVPRQADLTVSKSGPATAIEKDTITYVITTTNLGPAPAADVVAADSLPTQVASGDMVYISRSGSLASRTVTWPAVGSLAAGASIADTVRVVVQTAGTYLDIASAASSTADPDVSNNDGTAAGSRTSTTVTQEADLEVVKTGPPAALTDKQATYLITTTNNGPSVATNVVVMDTMPGPAFQFISASRGGTAVDSVVTWPTIASLAPGASVTDTLVVKIKADKVTVVNTGAATSDTPDPDPGNNTSDVSTVLRKGKLADIAIEKSGPLQAVEGDTLTYVITTTNLGPSKSDDTFVTDTLPAGVEFVTASRSGVPADTVGGRIVVTWPKVDADSALVITDTVMVVATTPGDLLDIAAAFSVNSEDPDSTNNDGSNPDARVTTTVVANEADLSVAKSGPASALVGDTLTYLITVSNAGPVDASDVAVTDSLPAGVTFVSSTPSQGSCSGSSVVTCDLGGVASDGGATVTIVVLAPATGGTIQNIARVQATETDPDTSDNRIVEETFVVETLAVTVTPDGADTLRLLPSNGTVYSYGFEITNGSDLAEAWDLLASTSVGSPFLTVDSIAGASVSRGARADSARLATLAPGASDSAFVWFDVGDVAAGSLDTLYLQSRSVNFGGVDDSGWVVVEVVRPAMSISKSVDPSGTQPPGTDLTYTIDVANVGSTDAVTVMTVDSLPAELRFKVGSVTTSFPAGIAVVVQYSNDDGSSWTYTPTSSGCGAPAGYDDCVTHIRWTLQTDLGSGAPDNAGQVEFVARIE